jgi:hypothetical protein
MDLKYWVEEFQTCCLEMTRNLCFPMTNLLLKLGYLWNPRSLGIEVSILLKQGMRNGQGRVIFCGYQKSSNKWIVEPIIRTGRCGFKCYENLITIYVDPGFKDDTVMITKSTLNTDNTITNDKWNSVKIKSANWKMVWRDGLHQTKKNWWVWWVFDLLILITL